METTIESEVHGRPLRIGIAGLGRAGLLDHLPALRQLPGLYTIAAVCDLMKERRDIVERDFPNVRTYRRTEDMLDDPERQQCYFSHIPHSAAIPTGSSVVLLRYHCVSDEIWGVKDLFMSPEKLEAQIELMEELGCSFLNFEDLDRIDQYEKPVFLTFDDGYDDNYTELYPILKRHNAKATIFVITGMIGNPYHMTEEMMREMDASGLVSFQSHTVSHANMNIASPEEREYEASESKLTLARLLGRIPFALSFPKARANAEAMACVARYYDYVVIADGEPWVTGSDPLRIPRFAMPRDITMETFRGYFDCFQ